MRAVRRTGRQGRVARREVGLRSYSVAPAPTTGYSPGGQGRHAPSGLCARHGSPGAKSSRGIAATNFRTRPASAPLQRPRRPARRPALPGDSWRTASASRASRGVGSANDRSRRDPIAPITRSRPPTRGQSWPERPESIFVAGAAFCRAELRVCGAEASDRDPRPVTAGPCVRHPLRTNQKRSNLDKCAPPLKVRVHLGRMSRVDVFLSRATPRVRTVMTPLERSREG